jgi:transcriptional regulator with XRE-family HTH domain
MSKRPTAAPCIVGQRLKSARDLACLSTAEAARRLGIKSPSRLTRAEHPSHPKGITPQLLADAARSWAIWRTSSSAKIRSCCESISFLRGRPQHMQTFRRSPGRP